MAALQETDNSKKSKGSLLWNLPTEIVIKIMRNSQNFSCLWSLINASSRFESIFRAVAWETVEEVMTKTTPVCTQALMRIVVNTRTAPDLFTGVSDVVSYMSRKKPIGPLLQGLSPQVLHDFVELAHTIHGVAHVCLEFYLEKLMTMKPQRIDDCDLEDNDKIQNMLYSERQSPGRPFQPKESGPPTYLEEQIVVRVLWRLQTFLNIKAASRTGRLAHWSEKEYNQLEMIDIPEMPRLFHESTCRWKWQCEMEQILSVLDFINEVAGDQYGQMENVLAHFLKCPPAVVYDRGFRLPSFSQSDPMLEKVNGLEKLSDIDNQIERRPMGWIFYYVMTTNKYRPINHASFKPYRKFGFALWHTGRMEELGFIAPKSELHGLLGSHEHWFIWRSILTPEEDAERRGMAIYWHMQERKERTIPF
ncbi:hypothetical protein UA08_02166 [Talaromyces atroroseus]|uniref:F-box domain-containing protein n=1 Tax=Talaromyces atroroseus TaxID=1441469 RepID=A0A225AJT6_TALAT|nr:hypothetical protein UA08_02166 [Talaromyces atroroseus]OKL61781.1 hypothetical protein UA08_02166 [Talaromyces atroroseus]